MLTKLVATYAPVSWISFLEYVNLSSYKGTKLFLKKINPEVLEIIGQRRALSVFKQCAKTIPAYKNYLLKHHVDPSTIRTVQQFHDAVPELDKANYVHKYSFVKQCRSSMLPRFGLLVESSGSTGKPTNWIEAAEENQILLKEVNFETEYIFHPSSNRYIVLSCWSLGPWTADLKFCYFFEHVGIVKNIGPSIENVIETMKIFGPEYKYIIGGYPPFLKNLVDSGKLNWKRYAIDLLTGGEGFVKGWRKYMLSRLRKGAQIFSSYGSSDLDTAMGIETPLCVMIKELLDNQPEVSKQLFGSSETPMVFQYDPTLHYIENSKDKKEFNVTKLNSKIPNIMVKYNIHDHGGVLRYDEFIRSLAKTVPRFAKKFAEYRKDALQLPFLWIGGRTDSTISINGTNVYPQQVESALLTNKELYKHINTFQISQKYEFSKDAFFSVNIELAKGIHPTAVLKRECQKTIMQGMKKYSREYAQAMREFPKNFMPLVELHAFHTGPFVSVSIKNKYIER